MPLLSVHNQQISWTPLLVLGYLFYLLLGAMVFQLLEKQAETHFRDQFQMEKLKFLQNYTCLDRQALEQFVQVRGTRSYYFGSSIISVRRNYTVLAKRVINRSAVHDIKGLTEQEKGRFLKPIHIPLYLGLLHFFLFPVMNCQNMQIY